MAGDRLRRRGLNDMTERGVNHIRFESVVRPGDRALRLGDTDPVAWHIFAGDVDFAGLAKPDDARRPWRVHFKDPRGGFAR